jgi:preprotein translocase subunit YajC
LGVLSVGDEIVTAGGIVGRITALDGDRVSLSVAPGVELTIVRGAVAQRATAEDPEDGGDRL